jgi:hypothetical protein
LDISVYVVDFDFFRWTAARHIVIILEDTFCRCVVYFEAVYFNTVSAFLKIPSCLMEPRLFIKSIIYADTLFPSYLLYKSDISSIVSRNVLLLCLQTSYTFFMYWCALVCFNLSLPGICSNSINAKSGSMCCLCSVLAL